MASSDIATASKANGNMSTTPRDQERRLFIGDSNETQGNFRPRILPLAAVFRAAFLTILKGEHRSRTHH
jgi:hypothetical protein